VVERNKPTLEDVPVRVEMAAVCGRVFKNPDCIDLNCFAC
jgi:hypothetical protein